MEGTADKLYEAIKASGVDLVVSLPDDWLVPLVDRAEDDPEMQHIMVAREPEIVGVCAGAWIGGRRPVALMGPAGLLACGHELVTFNFAHQIPLFVIGPRRGSIEDPHTYHVGQGLVIDDYLDAVECDQLLLEDVDDLALLPDAHRRALQIKRPLVCLGRHHLFVDS
jgi:sulfopyruvate decarboxylase TPP-binding subunit